MPQLSPPCLGQAAEGAGPQRRAIQALITAREQPALTFGRAELGHKLERALPALADVGLRGGWTGLRTFTPDRRPMLGEDPDRQGLWWASGLGGAGVTGCFAVGEAVAAWMRGEETPWLSRRAVSPGRPFPARFLIHPSGESWSGQLISAR